MLSIKLPIFTFLIPFMLFTLQIIITFIVFMQLQFLLSIKHLLVYVILLQAIVNELIATIEFKIIVIAFLQPKLLLILLLFKVILLDISLFTFLIHINFLL